MNNQRQHERYDVSLPVEILHGDKTLPGKTRNVSQGGMLIEGPVELPYGAEVKVRVTLPAAKESSDISATVRWIRDGAIGVQFGSLRAKETWALNQLMKLAAK